MGISACNPVAPPKPSVGVLSLKKPGRRKDGKEGKKEGNKEEEWKEGEG